MECNARCRQKFTKRLVGQPWRDFVKGESDFVKGIDTETEHSKQSFGRLYRALSKGDVRAQSTSHYKTHRRATVGEGDSEEHEECHSAGDTPRARDVRARTVERSTRAQRDDKSAARREEGRVRTRHGEETQRQPDANIDQDVGMSRELRADQSTTCTLTPRKARRPHNTMQLRGCQR